MPKDIDNYNFYELVKEIVLEIYYTVHRCYPSDVIEPDTELYDDLNFLDEDLERIGLEVVARVPLFTDITKSSWKHWKTVRDIYNTAMKLDKTGIQIHPIAKGHHKKGKY